MPDTMTFDASVGPRILNKVTRFFDALLTDVLNELVQNARRAEARRIDGRCISGNAGPAVVFRDGGCGIEDPRTVFMLGRAAGTLPRSGGRGGDTGLSMGYTPDHVTGKAPVTVEPPGDGARHGDRLSPMSPRMVSVARFREPLVTVRFLSSSRMSFSTRRISLKVRPMWKPGRAMELGTFSARLDVEDCPDLKLVLPAQDRDRDQGPRAR